MDFAEIMWVLCPLVYGILLGWAWLLLSLTPADFKRARILLWLAPIPLIVGDIAWVLTTETPFMYRAIVTAIIGAVVLVGLTEGLRWVKSREDKVEITQAANDTGAQNELLARIVANDDDAVSFMFGRFDHDDFVITVDGFVPGEADTDLHLLFGDEGGWESAGYKTFPLNQAEKKGSDFILAENLASNGKRTGKIKITLYQPLIKGTEKQISFESRVFTIAGVYSKFEGRGEFKGREPMNKVQLSVYPGVIRSGDFKLYGKRRGK